MLFILSKYFKGSKRKIITKNSVFLKSQYKNQIIRCKSNLIDHFLTKNYFFDKSLYFYFYNIVTKILEQNFFAINCLLNSYKHLT